MNVSPPHRETIAGKRQMFAMPTAEPMLDRMNPLFPLNPSRVCGSTSSVMPHLYNPMYISVLFNTS